MTMEKKLTFWLRTIRKDCFVARSCFKLRSGAFWLSTKLNIYPNPNQGDIYRTTRAQFSRMHQFPPIRNKPNNNRFKIPRLDKTRWKQYQLFFPSNNPTISLNKAKQINKKTMSSNKLIKSFS